MNKKTMFWFVLFSASAAHVSDSAQLLQLQCRSRVESTGEWAVLEKTVQLDAQKTAVVICDMWDDHWCKGASRRVAEMAPRMNEVVRAAHDCGLFIIHCPSDTMKSYEDTPQRTLAQSAPPSTPKVPLQRWCRLDPSREAPLPIDDSDGGCDDSPPCKTGSPWTRQIPAIEIRQGDAITDSAEAYYLMQQRGIDNVIVMGVHLNMCVLGRPFSIRQMINQGKNVLLVRDLTDTMYNSRKSPYVKHCVGTDLMVEHVEKYWCPTITSVDFIGGHTFRFAEDKRPRVLFMIGEDEYSTKETLPQFARKELEFRGIGSTFAHASTAEPNNFPGLDSLPKADLLFISVRRRTPSKQQMELVRQHLNAGKALAGIRTASHAFGAKPNDDQHIAWDNFDMDILGAKYQNHYGKGPATIARTVSGSRTHPVLTGIPTNELRFASHLYRSRNPAPTVTLLMNGQLEGRSEIEPIAWTNTNANRRVFYTSLGTPEDFQNPAFRRLLLNGILWALDQKIPPD